jgi:hypothetical protein
MVKIIPLIVLFFSTTNLLSQTFIQPNSHWHRMWDFISCPGNGYDHYKYVGDTLINNYLYSKIENKRYSVSLDVFSGVSNYYIHQNKSTFLRQNGDTIFVFDEDYSEDRFAWSQNPTVGELYYIGRVKNLVTMKDIKVYSRVDSISTEIIQDQNTKWIYSTTNLDSLGNPINYYTTKFNYICKLNTLLGPITEWVTPNMTTLGCYESSTTDKINYTGLDCNAGLDFDCQITTHTHDDTKENIKIFPNPSIGQITITNCNNQTIIFRNLVGKELLKTKIMSDIHNIDLKFLPNGKYMIFSDEKFLQTIIKL